MRGALAGWFVLLAGCSRPEWEGEYVGSLSQAPLSCTDGSRRAGSTAGVTWRIEQDDEVLGILAQGGDCNPFSARLRDDGSRASWSAKGCPSYSNGDYTFTPLYSDGVLSLDESAVTVAINQTLRFTGPSLGTCTTSYSGTLTRRRE